MDSLAPRGQQTDGQESLFRSVRGGDHRQYFIFLVVILCSSPHHCGSAGPKALQDVQRLVREVAWSFRHCVALLGERGPCREHLWKGLTMAPFASHSSTSKESSCDIRCFETERANSAWADCAAPMVLATLSPTPGPHDSPNGESGVVPLLGRELPGERLSVPAPTSESRRHLDSPTLLSSELDVYC